MLTIFYDGAQRIADNTVITTIGYLVALATLLLVLQVYQGFERQPVGPAVATLGDGRGPAGDHRRRTPPTNPPFRLRPRTGTRQHSHMDRGATLRLPDRP